ncbi:terpene cyclase [Streptomyces sp. NPDC007355]|uniref:terpene synthase family protein n=1 Tax=Streptomyces sp. NPDC007355 TaxID=3364778 RepID=UPI003694C898
MPGGHGLRVVGGDAGLLEGLGERERRAFPDVVGAGRLRAVGTLVGRRAAGFGPVPYPQITAGLLARILHSNNWLDRMEGPVPQDVYFELPFPLAVSPDLEGARLRNLGWVQRQGLITSRESLHWYASWDIPRLAAYGFPYAEGLRLDLCTDVMAFFFVFDDQLDGPLGRAPDRVAALCQSLIDLVHGAPLPAGSGQCAAAFAEVWARSCAGASAPWVARVAHEWEYYFASQAHEAVGRLRGRPAGMEEYLQVRRGIAGTALTVSMGERAAGIDVPAAAFHSPQLRIMREIAVDVPLMCNDVYSLEKEEARGDVDNLVLVLENDRRISREEAVAAARDEVHRRCARFQELAGRVPAVCDQLGLTSRERAAADVYVEVMAAWMSGYSAWQSQTLRYTSASEVVPSSGPGYFENVLGT